MTMTTVKPPNGRRPRSADVKSAERTGGSLPPERTPVRSPDLERLRRPIRVGFVVHVMQVAGAEVLVRETIHRLGKRIEPTIFCLDAVGSIGEQLANEGVPVICLGRRPRLDPVVGIRMAREIRRRGIQVLHAHQYTPFFYSALAKVTCLGRVRVIMTEHGRHYPDVVSPKRRLINRLVLDRTADAVNACAEFSARALCTHDGFHGRRIEVIENGIDLSAYDRVIDRSAYLKELGLDPTRQFATMIARFHPVKDHPMMLRAFAEVCRARPDVDLLLAGEGPGRAALEMQASELGITDRVRFLGVRKDVPRLLQAADLCVLTSVTEAASLTLMEAMAAGKPVVATHVGGNPEVVRHGIDGLLVPRGDHSSCARAILDILADPTRAAEMGRNGRRHVEARFQLKDTIENYDRLYRRLTGRGGE